MFPTPLSQSAPAQPSPRSQFCFTPSIVPASFTTPGCNHISNDIMARFRHTFLPCVAPRRRPTSIIMASSSTGQNNNNNINVKNTKPTTTTAAALLHMPESALEDLYRTSPVGTIPEGDTRGTMIFLPGTPVAPVLAQLVRAVAWSGKLFDSTSGTLLNKILPFGRVCTVRAKTYHGDSLLVPKEKAIVLDYTISTWPWSLVRDELRTVAPGVLLGPAYVAGKKWFYFALEDEQGKEQGTEK